MEDATLELLLAPILDIYSQIEIELLCNVAERFDTYDTMGGSLEWYMEMLQEMGVFKNDNIQTIRKYQDITTKELKHLLQDVVMMTSMKEVTADYDALVNSTANRNILNSITNSLLEDAKVINTKALESTEKAYMDTLTKAYIETTSGAYSYQESVSNALTDMADKGIAGATYERKDGSKVQYSLEATVRRDVLTRAHQTAVEVQMNNMRKLGHNLVYVSQHLGARVHRTNKIANHAGWQGKVYMLDGSSDKYPNLVEATGYGDIQGLAGVNCRHHISSFIEGVTKLPTRVDEEKNERIYKESQKQRKLERDVRKAKKQLAVAKQTNDENSIRKSEKYLRTTTKKLDDFIKEHPDMRRDYERTRALEDNRLTVTSSEKYDEGARISAVLNEEFNMREQAIKDIFGDNKPGEGEVIFEKNQYAGKEHEKAMANHFIEEYGGRYTILSEVDKYKVGTPDMLVDDNSLIEIKRFQSKTGIDSRTRDALKQLSIQNLSKLEEIGKLSNTDTKKKVLLLDNISDNVFDVLEMKKIILNRISRAGSNNNTQNNLDYAIIRQKGRKDYFIKLK